MLKVTHPARVIAQVPVRPAGAPPAAGQRCRAGTYDPNRYLRYTVPGTIRRGNRGRRERMAWSWQLETEDGTVVAPRGLPKETFSSQGDAES
jgi:hypothetical protein